MPYQPTVGNHESGEDFLPYSVRYNSSYLSSLANAGNNYYYSYDYGISHFIALSSETEYAPKGPQWQWLKNDLTSVNRNQTPWIIAYWHRPVKTFVALNI